MGAEHEFVVLSLSQISPLLSQIGIWLLEARSATTIGGNMNAQHPDQKCLPAMRHPRGT